MKDLTVTVCFMTFRYKDELKPLANRESHRQIYKMSHTRNIGWCIPDPDWEPKTNISIVA